MAAPPPSHPPLDPHCCYRRPHRDLYLCLAYLPPRTSTAYAQLPTPPVHAISSDLHTLAALPTLPDILLAGDINART